jgi:hypothetical protein
VKRGGQGLQVRHARAGERSGGADARRGNNLNGRRGGDGGEGVWYSPRVKGVMGCGNLSFWVHIQLHINPSIIVSHEKSKREQRHNFLSRNSRVSALRSSQTVLPAKPAV